MNFELITENDGARRGRLNFPRGEVNTPAFMPVGTAGTVKRELSQADRPVLVLSHQPLAGRSAIDNAGELQSLLGAYREKVVVCLNGHSHLDAHLVVDGVHYLHINSASYYWVGGKTRMAYYTQPLYTTVSIDPDSATVSVEASHSGWRDKSPNCVTFRNRLRCITNSIERICDVSNL